MGLHGTMPDVNDQNALIAQFVPPETSLLDFLTALNYAKSDDHVKALAVRIHDGVFIRYYFLSIIATVNRDRHILFPVSAWAISVCQTWVDLPIWIGSHIPTTSPFPS